MILKKTIGYVFIGLSIILAIAIFGQLISVYSSILDFFRIFTGTLTSYEIGKVVGSFIYWAIHFALTFLLWSYGRRWIKKTAS